jgi:hypothetical protein
LTGGGDPFEAKPRLKGSINGGRNAEIPAKGSKSFSQRKLSNTAAANPLQLQIFLKELLCDRDE